MSTSDRLAILLGLRIGGAVLALIGVWMLLGGSLAGRYGFGGVLVAMGVVGVAIVPALLARRWGKRR
jgi:hypothetical protein